MKGLVRRFVAEEPEGSYVPSRLDELDGLGPVPASTVPHDDVPDMVPDRPGGLIAATVVLVACVLTLAVFTIPYLVGGSW